MAYKDEREFDETGFFGKSIKIAIADKLPGPWKVVSNEGISPRYTEGPTIYKVSDHWIIAYDHYYTHHYGARSTKDFKKWDKISRKMKFPQGVRHGSVFTVEDEIAEILMNFED